MTDCIFCQIARHESPADIAFEEELSMAFTPLNPVTPGHLLVIPKKHSSNFMVPEPKDAVAVWATATMCARDLAKNGLADSFNLITSAGAAASQTVLHWHVHIVPRRFGDGLRLPWMEG